MHFTKFHFSKSDRKIICYFHNFYLVDVAVQWVLVWIDFLWDFSSWKKIYQLIIFGKYICSKNQKIMVNKSTWQWFFWIDIWCILRQVMQSLKGFSIIGFMRVIKHFLFFWSLWTKSLMNYNKKVPITCTIKCSFKTS